VPQIDDGSSPILGDRYSHPRGSVIAIDSFLQRIQSLQSNQIENAETVLSGSPSQSNVEGDGNGVIAEFPGFAVPARRPSTADSKATIRPSMLSISQDEIPSELDMSVDLDLSASFEASLKDLFQTNLPETLGTERRRRHSSWSEFVVCPWLEDVENAAVSPSVATGTSSSLATVSAPATPCRRTPPPLQATSDEVRVTSPGSLSLTSIDSLDSFTSASSSASHNLSETDDSTLAGPLSCCDTGCDSSTVTVAESQVPESLAVELMATGESAISATKMNRTTRPRRGMTTRRAGLRRVASPGVAQLPRAATAGSTRSPRRRQKHTCPYCDKICDTKYKLERHVRTHTGEKPFQCEVCHVRFNQKSSLKTHSTIHAKAVLRDPATTKKMVEEYTVNGHTFEALGIPYAGFVFDAIQKQRE